MRNLVKSSRLKYLIPSEHVISSDVADTPNRLINDFSMVTLHELHEMFHHIFLDQGHHVVTLARSYVGQAPSGFEYKLRDLMIK